MQFPITIGLRRSFLLTAFHLALGFGLLLVAGLVPWPIGWKMAYVLLGWGTLTVSAWWSARHSLVALRLGREAELSICLRQQADFQTVRLLPASSVHPLLVVMRYEWQGKTRALALLPDQLAADDFRRLRLWLKWQSTVSAGTGGAA